MNMNDTRGIGSNRVSIPTSGYTIPGKVMQQVMVEIDQLGIGEVSISAFIEAYAWNDTLGKEFMSAVEKWETSYDIVETYMISGCDVAVLEEKIARSVIENGIAYYESKRKFFAATAFYALLNLDRFYYENTGRHFKGYISCPTVEEKMAYLVRFNESYGVYMSGGHNGYEDR